jgi:hypothetical protein
VRHVRRAQPLADHRRLRQVVVKVERGTPEAPHRVGQRVDQCQLHPAEQLRVGGVVWQPVARHAADRRVRATHPGADILGLP